MNAFSQSSATYRYVYRILRLICCIYIFCNTNMLWMFGLFFQERWALSGTKYSLKGHWYWHVADPNYILGNPIIIPIYLIYFTRDVLISLFFPFYKGCFDFSILSILQQMFCLIYFTTDVKIPLYWDCQKGGQGETALSLYSILIIFYSASWNFSFHHQMF